MSDRNRIVLALGMALLLAGCGQTGKLYLPEPAGEIVTRPTQTPPPETGVPANSPQTVDSPPRADTPAPEVTEPESQRDEKDEEKKVDKKNPRKD